MLADTRPHVSRRIPPPPAPLQIEVLPSGFDRLRAHFLRASAERGLCPPMIELQLDLLLGGQPRPDKQQRLHHLARCVVCTQRVQVWKASWEGRAAQALAHAHRAARTVAGAVGTLWQRTERAPRERGRAPAIEEIPAIFPSQPVTATSTPRVRVVRPSTPPRQERQATKPSSPRPPEPPPLPRPRKVSKRKLSLILFETMTPRIVPTALLDAADERDAGVVSLASLDEAYRDRDFRSVRGIVLTRSRAIGDWPDAIRRVREKAPGVMVLAVVPAPRFARLDWVQDPAILVPPVSDEDWTAALAQGGWQALD